jgi:hypothetical protein
MNETLMFILFNPISCVLWFFLIGFALSWWDNYKKRK